MVFISPKKIYCANAGDSRAVLKQDKNRVVALSHDHRVENQGEIVRIQTANHHIADERLDGKLALTRGLGFFHFKD